METFHDIMRGLARPAAFLFLRHGESEGNVAGRMQGHRDQRLTETGRTQARATGGWFRRNGIAVDRLYSSPLSRAMETARIVADTAGLPRPAVMESVKEIDTGIFTGLSFPEIRERYPAEYQQFVVGSWEAVPEAESATALTTRALDTWRQLVAAANDVPPSPAGPSDGVAPDAARIMTVTHGGMLQWILKASFGATADAPGPWMPLVLASNCAIFEFFARPVSGADDGEAPTTWYYGQWSRVNETPVPETAPDVIPREQFHTGGDEAR
jgi:broad specificity phosphatase PhoE